MTIDKQYQTRFDTVLFPIAEKLSSLLNDLLGDQPRIDRISTRPKSVERFMKKASAKKDGKLKYDDPLHQIQDQIGARIITFYKDDVNRISELIQKYFHSIESKDLLPENEWEFGYFGNHHVLMLQRDLVDPEFDQNLVPDCFELQIKTLFQHAWSEANHDLGYKPDQRPLEGEGLRQLAFTSAQAWGADRTFNELFLKRNA
ncbi:MAG: RelA/SpoT domain-containing protein [Hyphomicrobiales bacterium]